MKRLLLAKKTIQRTRPSSAPFRTAFFLLLFLFTTECFAQQQSDSAAQAYKKTVTERAAKIVNGLNLPADQSTNITAIIASQYIALNSIHDADKAARAALKSSGLSKEDEKTAADKLDEAKTIRLGELHRNFLTALSGELAPEQVEQVKDGMTYRIFPVTYTAYLDMLPRLTEEQRTQIFAWLKEARELAMDEGTSERKHAVFGKYKGRINNYLSAAGYDMKKEGEEWQKRIKERDRNKAGG